MFDYRHIWVRVFIGKLPISRLIEFIDKHGVDHHSDNELTILYHLIWFGDMTNFETIDVIFSYNPSFITHTYSKKDKEQIKYSKFDIPIEDFFKYACPRNFLYITLKMARQTCTYTLLYGKFHLKWAIHKKIKGKNNKSKLICIDNPCIGMIGAFKSTCFHYRRSSCPYSNSFTIIIQNEIRKKIELSHIIFQKIIKF